MLSRFRNDTLCTIALFNGLLILKPKSHCNQDSPFTGQVPLCLPNFPTKLIRKQVLKGTNNLTHDAEWYVSYNKRTRIPDYVYERHIIRPVTTNSTVAGGGSSNRGTATAVSRQHAHFHAEPDAVIPPPFKSLPSDYSHNTGDYDRGHMCASANFNRNEDELKNTFSMSNVCPQNKRLNMGVWKHFEEWIRTALIDDQGGGKGQHSGGKGEGGSVHEVIIVTGPAFLPVQSGGEFMFVHKTIGVYPKLIHVPTHFFKVIVTIRRGSVNNSNSNTSGNSDADRSTMEVTVGAFLFPNSSKISGINGGGDASKIHTDAKNGRFDAFAVPLQELEILLGLQFLPTVGGGAANSTTATATAGSVNADAIRQAMYKLDELVHPIPLLSVTPSQALTEQEQGSTRGNGSRNSNINSNRIGSSGGSSESDSDSDSTETDSEYDSSCDSDDYDSSSSCSSNNTTESAAAATMILPYVPPKGGFKGVKSHNNRSVIIIPQQQQQQQQQGRGGGYSTVVVRHLCQGPHYVKSHHRKGGDRG